MKYPLAFYTNHQIGVRTFLISLVMVLAAVLLISVALAQSTGSQSWIQLNPTGGPPPVRDFGASTVFDPSTNRVILFGGYSSALGGPTNDVWLMTNANGLSGTPQWINLSPSGGPPPARDNHSAVYDQANNRMIIFGGCGGGCLPTHNDVWVLTNANGLGGTPAWINLISDYAPGSPSGRISFASGYDPATNRMIIFGGQNGGGSAGATFPEVWVLSNANGIGGTPAWTQLSTAGGPPPGQYGPSSIYDPVNNRLTVFAGQAQGTGAATNAVWVLSNANGLGGTPTWTNLVPEGAAGSPPVSGGRRATYDAANNRMTVLGGNITTPGYDAWVLSNANGLGGPSTWNQLSTGGGPSYPVGTLATVYDPASNRVTSFFTVSGTPSHNEEWVLSNANGIVQPPATGQTVLNFDSVNASSGACVSAESYLNSFGITLSGVTPGTTVSIVDSTKLYNGAAAVAPSMPNLLTQCGSNDPVTFTLNFPNSLSSVSFTRAKLLAGPSGITHPQWSAHAFDSQGKELATAGEALISSFQDVPAKTFTLNGPGIVSLRFDSNNQHFAAFSAVLIDDLTLTGTATTCAAVDAWSTKAQIPTPRAGAAVAAVNGQLYVATGFTGSAATNAVEAYDPATDMWSIKAPIPTARAYAGAAGINGKLYVVGGCGSNQDCRIGTTNVLEVYDPATNTWASKAPMPTARSAFAVGVIGNKLYVAGGVQACPPCVGAPALEVYDPATDTWTTKAPLPTSRNSVGATVINGQFYVVGGSASVGVTGVVEVYNPATDTWTTKAPMLTPRTALGVVAVNGILYAISGQIATAPYITNIVEAYDPASNTWTSKSPIPTARYGPQPAAINGLIYVAGSGASNTSIPTLEVYTPSCPTPSPTPIPNKPPVANAGADRTVEATSSTGATVKLDGSASSDPDGDPLTFSWNGPFGTLTGPIIIPTLPLGTSTITLTVDDGRGATATATVHVTVVDTTPPALTLPGNLTKEATSSAGAVVTFTATATDLVDGPVPVSCDHPSGLTFPIGSTLVSCSATDAHGNKANGSFNVTVQDTTPPTISGIPANMVMEAASAAGSVATWAAPTAADLVDGAVPVTCAPASGSVFPLGTMTVSCSATDSHGNRAAGGFTITVRDTTPPAVKIVNLTMDSIITSAPVTVSVQASDAVGVASVSVNGVAATFNPQSGMWQASVPVTLPVSLGGALSFTATATDPSANSASATTIVDNDGIAAGIDKNRTTAADESSIYSNDFNDGATSGTIKDRGGWTVKVTDLSNPLGVEASLDGAGTSPATITACGGSEKDVLLYHQGDTADMTCSGTSTITVKAVAANNTITATEQRTVLVREQIPVVVRYFCFFCPPRIFWTTVSVPITQTQAHPLSTGNIVSLGSPITASPDNTDPLTVQLLDDNQVPFGSFKLDPGASVDVSFEQSAPDAEVSVVAKVLSGTVTITVSGLTTTLSAGQTQSFIRDTIPPVIGPVSDLIVEATSPSGAVVNYTLPAVTDNADPSPKVTASPASGTTFPFGTTTVKVTATDAAGNTSTKTFQVTVRDTTPPAIQCAASDGLWHAGDVSITCTAKDGGSGLANPADATFSLSTSLASGTETANAPTNSHQVCDVAGNCATAGPITGNMVDKKAPTIAINAPKNTTYSFNQAVAADYTCVDGGSGPASCAGPVPTGSNIDTSSVGPKTFTVNAQDKVGNGSSLSINYVVTKAGTTTTIASSNLPSTYGQLVAFTATVSSSGGAPPGSVEFFDGPVSLGTAVMSGGSASLTTSALNAGNHSIRAVYAETANYFGSSSPTLNQIVNKATPTISWTNPPDITYGTPLGNSQLNATANVPGAFTYSPAAGAVLNAGQSQTLSVSFMPDDNSNYNTAAAAVIINVAKAPLSVTTDDKTKVYGEPNPPITGMLSGLQNGDNITVSFSTTAVPASPVGTYDIVPALADPTNRLGNYAVTSRNGTLTVTQAPLTVTADSKSKTYGSPNPALTVTYAGFVLGEGPGVLSGTLSLSTAATLGSGAGGYPITPGGLTSPNYAISFVPGTLKVIPAPLTVTAVDSSKTYGDPLPPFTVSYSGFVLSDNPTSLSGTVSFSTAATISSDAGTYAVTPAGLSSPNYAITFQSGTLTINKAPLTVTADNTLKILAAANPAFTASYSGFVLGQDPSVLNGTLVFTTPATVSSDVGTYPVTPGGLTSRNYAITYVDGKLTVAYNILLLVDNDHNDRVVSISPQLCDTNNICVLPADEDNIRLELVDAQGRNVSSASIVLHAQSLSLVAGTTQVPVASRSDFEFHPRERHTPQYRYEAEDIADGTYILQFTAGADPVSHAVRFQLR